MDVKLPLVKLQTRNAAAIPPLPLDMTREDMRKEWRSFRNGFEFYEYASGLREDKEKIRVSKLLGLIGKDAIKVMHSMKLSKKKKHTVLGILDALEKYFINGEQISSDTTEDSNTDDPDLTSSEEDLEGTPDVQPGIVGRFKAAQFKKFEAGMTEDQLKQEKEIEQQQLAAIFELLKRQQQELNLGGDIDESTLKEQLSLYR